MKLVTEYFYIVVIVLLLKVRKLDILPPQRSSRVYAQLGLLVISPTSFLMQVEIIVFSNTHLAKLQTF